MKQLIGSIVIALALSSAASAQIAPAAALATIAPPVQTADLPTRLIVLGAGIHNGQPSGFTNLLIHAIGPVYAAVAEDVTAGKTSTRAGVETIFFRQSGLYISAKGNAGVATGPSATGGSYGVGGSVLYDLTKLKAPGYVVVFSGTWEYSNIADVGTQLAAGNLKPVLSGGTFRFGIGKKF